MTYEQLYQAIKTYAEVNNLTLQQLANATQRQVVNALALEAEDKLLLGRCWNSLRDRVRRDWKQETEASELDALKAQAAAWLSQYFPQAQWEREGDTVHIYLRGKGE